MDELQDVTFPLPGGGSARGRLALPSGEARLPGVLVLHEILGLNDDIGRIALRFARSGYVALAPDFFGSGVRALCVLRAIAELRRPERGRPGGAFDILEAARRFLVACERVDADRIGVVGFCMGGGFAVLQAARGEIGVVGTFYGDVPPDAESLAGIPPVVAGFGGRDRVFGPGAERLRSHLRALDVPSDIRIYPNAGHSYMSPHRDWVARLGALTPMRVGYDAAAAEDSWERMLRVFARELASPGADPAT